MKALPEVTPQFAPQPSNVAWPTTQWPRGTSDHHDELDRVVDQMFNDEQLAVTNAVVIVQGGKVLVERYGGEQFYFDRPAEPIDADSQLLSWSMAKSVLHMIMGTLVDDRRLSSEQLAPVIEWANDADPRHQIRVGDLLAMRDGLAFTEAYELGGAHSHVIEMLYGDGRDNMAAFTAQLPLAHTPGAVFNYSSGTTNILSRIVADIVGYGDQYRNYLTDRLFQPIGMASATPTFDTSGVFVASSFLHATALDFARFGLLYLRGGEWDGQQLVSRPWAATAQIPTSLDPESGAYYSWQWWVTGDDYGTYWASGYEGQMISIVPALDALVLRFGHSPEEQFSQRYEWRRRVLDVLKNSIVE
jgi:CubicO group peptidase (beta-lactamase class C family)